MGFLSTIASSIKDIYTSNYVSAGPSPTINENIDKIKEKYNWLWNQLSESRQTEVSPIQNHFNEKRNIQQIPPTVSQKQYFFDSSEAKWDKISLCISGNNGILTGATTSGITNPNAQRILLFNINNGALQTLDTPSAARQGQNNIASACGDGYNHIITEDPLKGIFHTAIANGTLVTPQYEAASYATNNITSKGYAPRPIKLLGNGCAFAPAYGSTYYFSYTNATGQFDSPGWNMDTFTTQNPFPVETLSYVSGTSSALENIGDNQKLYVRNFGQSSSPVGTNIIDLSQIDPSIINQFYGPKTPIIYGGPITLIAPVNNYKTAALVTSILSQRIMTSSRMLTPNSGIGMGGVMNMANCGAGFPDINAFARDALDAGGNYVIMYDVVNATLNSSSIIGGEQIYSNFNLTAPANPQIGCFSDGTILIAYLENGRPAYFTFNPNAPSPAPAAIPSFPSPSTDLFINIVLPINLGNNPIPVTPDNIITGPSTKIIKFINSNGFEFFYPNGTLVTDGTMLPRAELYSLSLSQGNATKSSFPVLAACDTPEDCRLSTASFPFAGEGSTNYKLIIGLTAAGVFLITAVAAYFLYTKCKKNIFPFRNRLKVNVGDVNVADDMPYHRV